jgi:hypothetical protein
MASTSNWTKYKNPYEPMSHFTRHEPFPSDEVKATYIDGMRKRRKKDRTLGAQALEALERRGGRG